MKLPQPGLAAKLVALLLCGAAACTDEGPGPEALCETKLDLVDQGLWTLVPADTDPFTPPDDGEGTGWGRGPCPVAELAREQLGGEDTFSIYTRRCSWATLEQPALVAVEPGEAMSLRIWHFSQTIAEVAEARVIVAVDEEPFWEDTLPLPAQSGIFNGRFEAPFAVVAGQPIRWHLRNHGDNSWNFVELAVTREVPCDSLEEP